jgi:cell division septum initiation protein DivIVA
MEEILEKNRRLKGRVAELEGLLQRKSGSNTRAYDEIRAMIISKVKREVEQFAYLKEWQNADTRKRAEKQIMSDLKWDLRIRRVADFRDEHIAQAKEYIEKYVIPDELKKSRWNT